MKTPGVRAESKELSNDRVCVLPGKLRTEFESVIVDGDGTAYFVSVLVGARPLTEAAAILARQAAEAGKPPLAAVTHLTETEIGAPITDGETCVEASAYLKELGRSVLAHNLGS
jgi:hypothetical protein